MRNESPKMSVFFMPFLDDLQKSPKLGTKNFVIFGQNCPNFRKFLLWIEISAKIGYFWPKFRGRNFLKPHRPKIWNFVQFTKFRPSWQYWLRRVNRRVDSSRTCDRMTSDFGSGPIYSREAATFSRVFRTRNFCFFTNISALKTFWNVFTRI